MSLSLKPSCPVCNGTNGLLRCQGCKVTLYCSRDHQVTDRPSHKSVCNGVKKAQSLMDKEEQKLRAQPGDFMTPPGETIFENEAGHFWGIVETRPYMRARYQVVMALLEIQTYDAVQAAHEHIMDMLRLCRGDNMGVRDHAPALFLRLGKDQACYDFCKWYATEGQRDDYDWGDTDLGFINLKDEDVFKPVDIWTKDSFELSHMVAIALIKFRLLLDIKALQKTTLIGEKVPQELLDNIRGQLVSSVVAGNKDIMESKDQSKVIETLEAQVEQLFKAIKKSNKYFWPALLSPKSYLTATPQAYSHGSREHMVITLQYNYRAWAETPGAIDMIRELSAKL